jgi:hypothetical protein
MINLKLALALLITYNAQAAAASTQSVDDFLQKQTLVRVCLSRGPGMGDQANAANVMNHLRQMGYQGKFEVVYENEVVSAVTTVFNLPKTIPPVYDDANHHIRFIEFNTYEKLLAADQIDVTNFSFGMGKSANTCDFENIHAKTYAHFVPYFDSRGLNHDATQIDADDLDEEITQIDSGKKYLISPIPTYEQAKDFLHQTPVGKEVMMKKPALQTLLDGIDTNQFNIMFVYGYTLQLYGNGELANAGNILETLAGLRYAQLHGPAELKKPIIVAVFYDYKKDAETILKFIHSNDWGDAEMPGSAEARAAVQALKLGDVLTIADIADPDTIRTIQTLPPNSILLLSMGAMPKTVFDGMYNHVGPNILPQVREGAGTFNTLVATGRPSLECALTMHRPQDEPSYVAWTPGLDLVSDPVLRQTLQQFYDSREGYCGMQDVEGQSYMMPSYAASWRAKSYQSLGQFVIDAHDVYSPLSQYFQALKADVSNPENDRVRYALTEVIKHVN